MPHVPTDRPLSRRWWGRTLALNALIALAAFAAIQLVPASRENPPVEREPVWDAPQTRDLAVRACYDCHSNETDWPAYSAIAPVRWVIWYDVVEGREALNFSEWDRHVRDDYVDPDDPFPPPTLSERIEDEIRAGTMPPGSYRLLNPGARLTDAEKEALIEGLIRTVRANQEPPLPLEPQATE